MDWVAPDAAPATPPPRPPSAPAVPAAAPRLVARRLGPRTTADILDGAFAVIKQAPATIIGLTAIFVIPAQIVATWMANQAATGDDPFAVFTSGDTSFLSQEDQGSATDTLWIYGAIIPSTLALVFVAAGIARLISAWQVGHDLTIGELLRGLVPRAWALVASALLIKAAQGIGTLGCFFPALAIMALCLVTVPAIAAEQLGPIAAIKRSCRLAQRRFWAVLGIGVLVGLVSQLFANALQALPLIVAALTGGSGVSWPILAALSSLSSLLTVPVVGASSMLVYLDLRVRTEGLDLELDAIDLLPTPAA